MDTLIFSYVGSDHFWGLKILNFNILQVLRKMNCFLGYDEIVDNLGG